MIFAEVCSSGDIVAAADCTWASIAYRCPKCKERVNLIRPEGNMSTHFRHRSGNDSHFDCENYVQSMYSGYSGQYSQPRPSPHQQPQQPSASVPFGAKIIMSVDGCGISFSLLVRFSEEELLSAEQAQDVLLIESFGTSNDAISLSISINRRRFCPDEYDSIHIGCYPTDIRIKKGESVSEYPLLRAYTFFVVTQESDGTITAEHRREGANIYANKHYVLITKSNFSGAGYLQIGSIPGAAWFSNYNVYDIRNITDLEYICGCGSYRFCEGFYETPILLWPPMRHVNDRYVAATEATDVFLRSEFELTQANTDNALLSAVADQLYTVRFDGQLQISDKCDPLFIAYMSQMDMPAQSEEITVPCVETYAVKAVPLQDILSYYKAVEPYQLPEAIPEQFSAMPDILAEYLVRCKQKGQINACIQRCMREGDYGFFQIG